MMTDELERDLTRLAEPHDTDDQLRLAIRERLGEQIPASARPRARRTFAFAWAAAGSAAIAAVVVAAGLPGRAAGPSVADAAIVHHALQAVSWPANAIVHVKEVGVQDGTPIAAEWWQQTSAPHALRMIKGQVGQEQEASDDGTTLFRYDASTNTVVETPDSSAPALVDPIEVVRDELEHGQAQVAGTVTIDGTSVYKIELPNGVTAYFDTTDYRPLYLDNPQRDGSVVRTRVVTYEELPVDAGNAKLLSVVAQHPGARVSTEAAPVK